MTSTVRLLADSNNALTAATISAPVTAASNQAFRQPTTRTGSGLVRLTGGYTGAANTVIDLQITAPASGNEGLSSPVFSGAGNGTLTGLTVAGGTAAQAVALTCVDVGTETSTAQAILYADVLIQARTAGPGGNAISLNLTPSLTLGATVGALASALSRDSQEWTDQKLDFGSAPLNPDGTLSAASPRLVFNRDISRVYRHYKRWDGTQWQYGVSPKLASSYPEGALVQVVSGDYDLTVTDGVTTENFTGTSLYDVLLALSGSALVQVASVIGNDRKPGGMAAIDPPFRTAAFALPIEKSRPELLDLQSVIVATTAPTETVTVTCTDDTAIGAETWAVRSKVAGALADAVTGVPYTEGFVGFTVPIYPLDTRPVEGRIGIAAENWVARESPSEGVPAICLARPLLGAAASNQVLKLVWTERPADDCDCTSGSMSGGPLELFLGVDIGEEAMSVLAAGHRARLEALITWHKGFIATNTAITAAGELRTADNDLDLALLGRDTLLDCLTDMYTDAAAILTETARANSTAYAVDAVVEPTPRNGYRYRCTVAGTSAGSAPTWPTTLGTTVTDGGVTWKCATKTAETAWDAVLSGLSSDLTPLASIGAELAVGIPAVAGVTAYTAGAVGWFWYYLGSAVVGRLYGRCVIGGTTDTVFMGSVGTDGLPIVPGDNVSLGSSSWVVITKEEAMLLKSGDAADVSAASAIIDDPGILRTPEAFSDRYLSACNEVRAIAGLSPKKDSARRTGSAVWQDQGSDYWVIQGTEYLPVFNGAYYHACIEVCDPITGCTTIEATREFGFGLQVGCPERLKYGDSITIAIGDVSITRPYQKGDVYSIPLVAGGPLALAGGQTGTDTLTWSVYSSTAGALANYSLTTAELPYSAGGLGFTLHRGAIPFALGDRFSFAVEAGDRFKWRQDGGAWSAATALTASVALTAGLTAEFTRGPAPSWALGDVHTFIVKQPGAPALAQTVDAGGWIVPSSSAAWTATWAADQTLSAIAVLQHTLVAPATVSIALKNAGGTTLQTIALTVANGPLVAFLASPVSGVRSLVATVASASGMTIDWLYAGTPLSTFRQASTCTVRRVYALERGGGLNPRGAYRGAGSGGEVAWQDGLDQTDAAAVLALVDACKRAGDRPICVVPHFAHPDEAAVCRIASDDIEVTDLFEYQPTDTTRRRLSITLPLTAIVQ